MCSTFKLLLAGCILSRVDAGKEQASQSIPYTEKDLLEYAPVTRANLAKGSMPLFDLCAAAVEVSDNTAANLLLAQIGGPAGLTQYLRSIGNQVTRLDRMEPDLNAAIPGDPRDTTSPAAMVDSMQKLLIGDALSSSLRDNQLLPWLTASTTGSKRLRAGIPATWRAGDKTGGDAGTKDANPSRCLPDGGRRYSRAARAGSGVGGPGSGRSFFAAGHRGLNGQVPRSAMHGAERKSRARVQGLDQCQS